MKRTLVLALAGAFVATVAGCGGGGGGGSGSGNGGGNGPTTTYGGLAYTVGAGCAFALGVIGTGSSSASRAEQETIDHCNSEAEELRVATGALPHLCSGGSFEQCAAIGVGQNSAGRCNIRGHQASSISAASADALQYCRNQLGSSANCQVLAATCASGQPVTRDWRPGTNPPNGGIGPNQVGDEFGRSSTTGRTNLVLTCTNDVIFRNQGTVVLPSVDIVALPLEAGTVTLEYDAYDIPDRFIVEVDRRNVIDTQYVGSTSYTVMQVNDVLNRYNFTPTRQRGIVPPGRGSMSFQKTVGATLAVVRVYAPLQGTEWQVTLKFSASSCQTGPGTGRYGAVASSLANNCRSRHGGIVANYPTQSAARAAAIDQCRSAGGSNCGFRTDFGSAYQGNNQCGALAYGESQTRCIFAPGTGGTLSQAESDALSTCRGDGFSNCRLLPASDGSRFALCTN